MSWRARASTRRIANSNSTLARAVAGKRARPAASLHCLDAGGRAVPACSTESPTALVVSRNGRCACSRGTACCSFPLCANAAGSRSRSCCGRSTTFRRAPTPSILLYWGWYWRPVYESAYLIVAQLLFAYAFDLLLTWSRRDTSTLGFGPFPIVLSTNLFLWFKPDWFYLQFLMIAVGFAAQGIHPLEQGRTRDAHLQSVFVHAHRIFSGADSDRRERHHLGSGHRHHAVLSAAHVPVPVPRGAAGTIPVRRDDDDDVGGADDVSLWPGVTTPLTGTYYFFDSYIPIAVFLGMHLLFTDPSTAPRTELGRMIFGVLYGLSTIALYALLGIAGLPDVLRQAPAGPAAQPVDQIDRPGGAIDAAAAVRSGADWRSLSVQPPQSGVHVASGRSCLRS